MAHPTTDGVKCGCEACLAERRVYSAARRASGANNSNGHDMRSCRRCGVDWDAFYRFHIDAPCRDCRGALKAEGDTTKWRGSPKARALQSLA